jgi:hypothetical protein
MERECSGCKWISGEIDRRNGLMNRFQREGDYRFAQIAQEGIGALVRDWRAHVQRDHGTDAKSILTLPDAVKAPGYVEYSTWSAPQQHPIPGNRRQPTSAERRGRRLQLVPSRSEPCGGWSRIDVWHRICSDQAGAGRIVLSFCWSTWCFDIALIPIAALPG